MLFMETNSAQVCCFLFFFLYRSVFWPCGDCRLNCSAKVVQCECCNSWYHYQCQNVTLLDIEYLVRPDSSFTCLDCFKQEIGSYSYQGAIFRLGLVRYRIVKTKNKTYKPHPNKFIDGLVIFLFVISKFIAAVTSPNKN